MIEAEGQDEVTVASKGRPLRIKITEGAIRQNLLTLTSPVKRGLMRVGVAVAFPLPDGEILSSTIMQSGNRLQERGRVRELYRKGNVRPGDVLVFGENGLWPVEIDD